MICVGRVLFALVLTFELLGCGKKDKPIESPTATAAIPEISFAPSSGTYNYAVFVRAAGVSEGTFVEIKQPDGSWKIAESCYAGGGFDTNSVCINVSKTQDITYRVSALLSDPGPEKKLSYVINHPAQSITISTSSLAEQKTLCDVALTNDIRSLRVRMIVKNDAVIGANKLAYLFFSVPDLTKIKTDIVNMDDNSLGITLADANAAAPLTATEYNVQAGGDKCTIQILNDYMATGYLTGSIECSKMSSTVIASATPFGAAAVINKFQWQCNMFGLF